LEGMTRCFTLRDYAFTSKVKIMIFQLRDSVLNWWGNLERHLHLTRDTVSWEIFEERFRRKYFPTYYEEQQVGEFHALVQGNIDHGRVRDQVHGVSKICLVHGYRSTTCIMFCVRVKP
jgi:hypothetical protein